MIILTISNTAAVMLFLGNEKMELVKYNLNKFYSYKLLFVVVICNVFLLVLIQGIDIDISSQEILLLTITEEYQVSFFELPMFIYFIMQMVMEYPENIIIRYEKMHKYYLYQIVSFLISSIVFVLIQCMAVFPLCMQVSYKSTQFTYSGYESLLEYSSAENLLIFMQEYENVIHAIMCSILYKIVGYFVLSIMIYALVRGIKRIIFTLLEGVAICIIAYILNNALYVYSDSLYIYYFALNNYIDLLSSLKTENNEMLVLILICIVSVLSLFRTEVRNEICN